MDEKRYATVPGIIGSQMTSEELYDRYRPLTKHPPRGVIVLSEEDARRMIDDAEDAGLPISGVDAFYLRGDGKIEPSLAESSLSFSGSDTWAQARSFLASKSGRGLHFEVIARDA